jgi:anti-sigma factor RsiW
MTEQHLLDLLQQELDGALGSAAQRDLRQQLASDPNAIALRERLQAVDVQLRHAPTPPLPAQFTAQLHQRLATLPAPRRDRLNMVGWYGLFGVGLLWLLGLVIGGWWLWQNGGVVFGTVLQVLTTTALWSGRLWQSGAHLLDGLLNLASALVFFIQKLAMHPYFWGAFAVWLVAIFVWFVVFRYYQRVGVLL